MRTPIALLLAALALPASAHASDIDIRTNENGSRVVTVDSAPGQDDDLTISQGALWVTVADPQNTLDPGPECYEINTHTVGCGDTAVVALEVELGDGEDALTIIDPHPATVTAEGPEADRIEAGFGPTRVEAGAGGDVIVGGPATDTLDGGGGDDTITGSSGDDVLTGGQGGDTFVAGAGADRMAGGPDADVVDYGARTKGVAVSLNGVADDGAPAGQFQLAEHDDVAADIERIVTGAGDDTIDSLDGVTGEVRCGGGVDRLNADSSDVASDCETRTPAEPTPAPTADPVPTATATATPVVEDTLAPRLTKVRRRGRTVRFRLSEPARVTLRLRRGRTLTRTLPAGAHRIALGRGRVARRLRLVAVDPAGNRTKTLITPNHKRSTSR